MYSPLPKFKVDIKVGMAGQCPLHPPSTPKIFKVGVVLGDVLPPPPQIQCWNQGQNDFVQCMLSQPLKNSRLKSKSERNLALGDVPPTKIQDGWLRFD